MKSSPNEGFRPPLAVITGAANGLGLQASHQLAGLGFDLLLVDRNVAAGETAKASLQREHPARAIVFSALDLSDQAAISTWTKAFRPPRVDVLLNNAGLFPSFSRRHNAQNCELGLTVGFYGHYALTAGLLPQLLAAESPRVVTVSSIAHASGRLNPADPLLTQDYDANRAYSACKLACLLFAWELQAQARLHNSHLLSLAAHPGISRTSIGQYHDNPASHWRHHVISWATRIAMRFLGQEADQGARSLVHAATASALGGGEFIGPGGLFQFKGAPTVVAPRSRTLARHDAKAIWLMAEEVTGLAFEWDAAPLSNCA